MSSISYTAPCTEVLRDQPFALHPGVEIMHIPEEETNTNIMD